MSNHTTHYDGCDCVIYKMQKLEAENARYREALEFYAWTCEPTKIQRSDNSGTLVIVEDKEKALACYNEDLFLFGKRAREALKGGE
jgi:hypothetical protein